MVTVGEFCNRSVVTVGKTDTMLEAARRMRVHHVGCLVIATKADGRVTPVGIITDRDIVVGVLATAREYLDTIQVADLATEPLVTARENESLADALARMRGHGIRRMPVVDEKGALVGLVAFDDILEFLSGELADLAALVDRERRREVERRI
ncbi:CBS domain-containing protein [Sorangium sp. So ce363]|uniref:CBS domain-containing protein n=1 Tax=Sorangium sp. So ce363 TaxID=3133304 RepID=UPI003F638AAC